MKTEMNFAIAALTLVSTFAFAQATPPVTLTTSPTSVQTSSLAQVPVGVPQTPLAPPVAAPATPTPAPVVGMNIDPPVSVQAQTQGQLPTADDIAKKMMQQAAEQRARSQQSLVPARGGPLPMTEQVQTKSEVIPVLPPAQKVSELRAVLRTSVGDITIRLDHANAPHTVDYFTGLAKGDIDFVDVKTSKPVKRPFYNGLIFHRVIKNTLIQTGDPFGNGRGDSGQVIADEIKPSMKFDRPGMVAFAPARDATNTNIAKNTNSSQFFITARELPEWNGQYTIIGQVEDGMDVVQKIANVKVGPTERPIKRIYLVAVEIIESNK